MLWVLGCLVDTKGIGRTSSNSTWSSEVEENARRLVIQPGLDGIIVKFGAPSGVGSDDHIARVS